MTLQQRVVPTPVGALTLVASDRALVAVLWPDDDPDRVRLGDDRVGAAAGSHRVLDAAELQLEQYFEGRRTDFDLPLAPAGTEFQQRAWTALRSIPYGETRSYREQAELMGQPTAVRAVGAANGRNPLSVVVPCHRVVGADGSLTGFAGGVDAKRFLLDLETRGGRRRRG